MLSFNTAPLTREPTPAEAASIRQRYQAGEFGPRADWLTVSVLIAACLFSIPFVINGVAMLMSASRANIPWLTGMFALVGVVFPLLFIGGLALVAILMLRRHKSWMRLVLFADANGLRFGMRNLDPRYPGLLFNRHGSSTYHVWSPTGVLADAGGYEYSTGSGKSRRTHRWNFAAFRMPRQMPHILLDSVTNGLGNLPARFSTSQVVALGEPFDSSYRLYAPDGYESDAFRIFPPDLMARLMDAPQWFDIEIVDEWLFCYTQQPMDVAHPDTWRMIEYIQGTLVARIADVAARYDDDRVTPREDGSAFTPPGVASPTAAVVGIEGRPVVAGQGRRLRSNPWGRSAIVLLGALIAFAMMYGVGAIVFGWFAAP